MGLRELASMRDYEYFKVLYLGKENRCLHAIHHNSKAIHRLSIYQLLNG